MMFGIQGEGFSFQKCPAIFQQLNFPHFVENYSWQRKKAHFEILKVWTLCRGTEGQQKCNKRQQKRKKHISRCSFDS